MKTKLTVTIDEELLPKAETHASHFPSAGAEKPVCPARRSSEPAP